ncbi:alpha/beta fold hydrolase [Sediminibacillus albus]|uniref:Pimeloyl-ACP methyl ester carboxylesterase n=1 Tax=Sediminibacillus albus TaxID=407036 RepID=A0A1G8YZV7_9BACI|nr:alpha/beta hydrolase [Sediminibacillus albus]SDK08313.1 Pimeloyl-ACP methyl ester carboxylesterase [Sediminibacillus albus]
MRITNKKKYLQFQHCTVSYQIFQTNTSLDKPYIIFIHGFLSSQFSFRKMIPLLIDKFHIITIDLPPFGDSEKNRNCNFSYRWMAELIIFFMDKLAISKASIAGHSMGGQIAMVCAYYYPGRIEKLFLMAPSCYLKKASNLLGLISRLPISPYLLRKLFQKIGVKGVLEKCIYFPDLITKRMLAAYRKPFLDKNIYYCLSKMIRDREGDLNFDCLKAIKLPCVIFWGKKDQIIPISNGYQLIQHLPNAELCAITLTGHFLPEEAPEIISEYIKTKT